MNKLKRIAAVLAVAATVSALSVSAFAVDYKHYEFDLSPKSGSYAFSAAAEKQDNEDKAMALCTGGDVSSTRYVNLSIYKSSSYNTAYCIADPVPVTSVGGPEDNYEIKYKVTRGAGSKNYLCASAGYYAASVKGRWDP